MRQVVDYVVSSHGYSQRNGAPDYLVFIAAAAALTLAAIAASRELKISLQVAAPLLVAGASCLCAVEVAFAFSTLAVSCLLIAEIDRRSQIIPDMLVLSVALLAAVAPFGVAWELRVFGATLLGLLFLFVRWGFAWAGRTEALGWGDVKFAAVIGGFLGPQDALTAVCIAGIATVSLIVTTKSCASAPATDQIDRSGAPLGVGLAGALTAMLAVQLWGGL